MKWLALICLAVLLNSCATQRMTLAPDYWKNSDRNMAVVMTAKPLMQAYMQNAEFRNDGTFFQDFEEFSLNQFSSRFQLTKLKLTGKLVESRIRKRGLMSKWLDEPFVLKAASKGDYRYDVSKYKSMGYSHVVVLRIERMGTLRDLLMAEVENKKRVDGLYQASVAIVNTSTNNADFQTRMSEYESTIRYGKAPEMNILLDAFKRHEEKLHDFIMVSLFGSVSEVAKK